MVCISIVDDDFDGSVTQTISFDSEEDSDLVIPLIAFGLYNNNIVQTVDFSERKISNDSVVAISRCLIGNKTLKELDLSHSMITNCGMNHLQEFLKKVSHLKYIDLSGNDSSPWAVYCVIIRNCCVESLMICGDYGMEEHVAEITDSLEENQILKSLTLHNIGRKGVGAIKEVFQSVKNTALSEVNLLWNKITRHENTLITSEFPLELLDDPVAVINGSRMLNINILCSSSHDFSLTVIDLSYMNIDDDRVAIIMLGFYSNKTVKELCSSHNRITDTGAKYIVDTLALNSTLQTLDISENKICDLDIISDYVKDNLTIIELVISLPTTPKHKVILCMNRAGIVCNISGEMIGDAGALIVSAMLWNSTTVRHLDLSTNEISDTGALHLSNYLKNNTTLQEIDLSCNRITGKGVQKLTEAIQHSTVLQKINFSENRITDDGAVAFTNYLTKNMLKVFDLSANMLTIDGINRLTECAKNTSRLEYVDLSGNGTSPWGLYCAIIRHCCVRSLTVCGDDGMEKHLQEITDSLETNNKLKSLTLYSIGRIGLKSIKKVLVNSTKLKEVNLSWMKIDNDGTRDKNNYLLTKCPLKILNDGSAMGIFNIEVDINILYEGHHEYSPKVIDLSDQNLDEDAVALLSFGLYANTTVKRLEISFSELADVETMYNCLKNNSVLTELVVSLPWSAHSVHDKFVLSREDVVCKVAGKRIGDGEALMISAMLSNSSKIRKLDVSSNRISDDGAVAISDCIKDNNTLQEIDLSHNYISDKGAINIAEAIKISAILRKLNISYNNICDVGADAITMCLGSLEELNLSYNKITSNGIVKVAKNIEVHTMLQRLDVLQKNSSENEIALSGNHLDNFFQQLIISLPCNGTILAVNGKGKACNMFGKTIGDDGALLISAMLYKNTNVKVLNVANGSVFDLGIIAISRCLKENHTLQELNMSGNFVSVNGAAKIGEFIETNSTLCKIHISSASMQSDGVEIICNSLRRNTSLQEVDISYNSITNEGANKIAEVIQVNLTLQKFDISYCGISDNGAVVISDSYKCNTTLQELVLSWKNDEVIINTVDTFWDLSSMSIGDTGAQIVSNLLFNNLKVKQLDVSNNEISDSGAVAINKSLKNNDTLEEVDISENNLSRKGANMLFKTVKTVKFLKVTTKFMALQHIKIAIFSLMIFVVCLFCFVYFCF